MLVYLNMLFQVTFLMQHYPPKFDYQKKDNPLAQNFTGCLVWLMIEYTAFLSIIISNVMFLFFRTVLHHKIQLDKVPERKQLPAVDTIVAIKEVSNSFNAMFIPASMSTLLLFVNDNLIQSVLFPLLAAIYFSNVLGGICIFTMIFVHWKKGAPWWTRISPVLYVCLLYFSFVIMPGIVLVISMIYSFDPNIDLLD